MKRNAWWLLFGVCALGLVCGYAARHAASGTSESSTAGQTKAANGGAKLWAQKNLASTWNGYDPAAVRQWTASLDPDSREAVQEFLENPGNR